MKFSFRRLLCLVMVMTMILPMTMVSATEIAKPVLTSEGFDVTITEADSIKDIRFAIGEYTTAAEVKAAEGNVALSNDLVKEHITDGVFSYSVPAEGYYTFWVRMTSGESYFLYTEIEATPYVSSYGVRVTVHNLSNVKDFYIAEGQFDSYREVKDNGYIVSISAAKIGTKHEYTYTVYNPGIHTVVIRYNDGSQQVLHHTLTVDQPEFSTNGLQVTVSNLPDIKVIRTAYGSWSTTKELKATDTLRNFSAKTAIKGRDPYTIQYREEGAVTVIVEYNNGYIKVFHYDVHKNVPTVTQTENTVTFGNLDNLQVIRYAPGKYSTASEIKNAPGCVNLTPDKAENGIITVSDLAPGSYSFVVQYTDESFNYYTITVEGEETKAPTATDVSVSMAFSDNMILQRDEKLSVWGTADANSGSVEVSFGSKTAWAEVDEMGNWKAVFEDTFAYTTEGQSLTVSSAEGDIVFNDVLVGDVYYAIGQSNMYYSLGELVLDLKYNGRSSELDIDYDDNRNMRFYRISSTDYTGMTGTLAQGTETLYTDVYNDAYWMKPSDVGASMLKYANFTPTAQLYDRDLVSSNVFSAIGYIFAYEMTEKTDVPVGVIEIDASGHPLITFAPNELAEKWGDDAYDEASGTYYYSMDTLSATHLKSRYAYNQQIYPLSNFSCAGILWYQGESDWYNTREYHGRGADTFATQFTELMEYFRATFGNDDFDVYMFEYAPCYSNNGINAYMDFASVRTELGTIPQRLDNCHIVSSSDLWFDGAWLNNVHPYIKHYNAYRLTDIVLADKFGIGDLELVSGPVLSDVEYGTTNATLTFDNVGTGLKTATGGAIQGIDIMVNTTGVYQWIEATNISFVGKNQILIDPAVQVFGVRYNGNPDDNFPNMLNLCNSHGMPAIAFVDYKVNPIQAGTDSGLTRSDKPTKYFTMSFDDGVTQDEKLIEILKKHDVDCTTFYINTGLCGVVSDLSSLGIYGVKHQRFTLEQLCSGIYSGFDVGVHTLTHPGLSLYDNNIARQKLEVEGDAINIENITGYQPVGMAYPGGDFHVTETTIQNLLANTNIRFARGIMSTGTYNLPTRFMQWQPTCHIVDSNLMMYADRFINAEATEDMLFYVWGHGYEFDQYSLYDDFEELIVKIKAEGDIVMLTNSDFYQLYKKDIPS